MSPHVSPGCPVCRAPKSLERHCPAKGCPWWVCALCGSYGRPGGRRWADMRQARKGG